MATEIKIPAVGESITEVQINEWLKAEGDSVKQDEPLAVIDSEKTTFELPAPQDGKLVKILHQAGETVKIGAVVAQFEAGGEATKTKPVSTTQKTESPTDGITTVKSAATAKPAEEKPQPVAAETAADELQKEILTEKSEKESLATKPEPDAKAKVEAPPRKSIPESGREQEVVPMTMLRRTIAKHLVEATQMMAMLTTFNEIDLSAVQILRKQHQAAFEKRYQVKLGLMSFFVKAAIDALKQFPQLNAEVRENDIVYHNYFDIGVAIASERGLVVPALKNAERLSFAELEKTIGNFSQRAQTGKLKPDELGGGTFTITNGGVFGSLFSTPIINSPQTGILGLHTIQERPVAIDGQIVIRPMMYVALTYDHRIVDGREAVLFLQRIKETIEMPARMLIEV